MFIIKFKTIYHGRRLPLDDWGPSEVSGREAGGDKKKL